MFPEMKNIVNIYPRGLLQVKTRITIGRIKKNYISFDKYHVQFIHPESILAKLTTNRILVHQLFSQLNFKEFTTPFSTQRGPSPSLLKKAITSIITIEIKGTSL